MIICKKHPPQQINFVCLKPACSMGNLLCQQCITMTVQHRQEHRLYLQQMQDFQNNQNGTTKSRLIPQINEQLVELEKRVKELGVQVDKDVREIESDIAQLFKIFYDVGENYKQQLSDLIRKAYKDAYQKHQQLKTQLQDYLLQDGKKKYLLPNNRDNSNLFQQIFSGNQDTQLQLNEQTIHQIINRNYPLNQIRVDVINQIEYIQQSLGPQSTRVRYKTTQNHQQIFQMLKQDLHQTISNLFLKLTDLTQENQSVDDLKKSLYMSVPNDTTRSLKQSLILNNSSMASSKYLKSNSSSMIISFKLLESFPQLHPNIQNVIQQLGPFPNQQPDSLINSYENVGPCQFGDGVIYQGQIRDNQRFGQGKAIVKGQYYEGLWRDNEPFGFCRLISQSGEYYEGQCLQGRAHGKGKYKNQGYTYEGDWVEDQRSGKGFESLEGKFKYEGEFKNNKKHGSGNLADLRSMNVYEGIFENGFLNGEATIRYANGNEYRGEVITKEGQIKRHGQGIFLWNDGRRYEGQYENDLEHGDGTFFWPDQWMFKGQWQQGQQHGQGYQISPQGKDKEGIWQNGKFIEWIS